MPNTEYLTGGDFVALLILVAFWVALMAPFDLLGGYILPTRFQRSSESLANFGSRWLRGVLVQSLSFLGSAGLLLTVGRYLGLFGVITAIVATSIILVAFQRHLMVAVGGGEFNEFDSKVDEAFEHTELWGLGRVPYAVISNRDKGSTGGVVGLPFFESILVPRDQVDQLTTEQLAIVLARRQIAIASGSRTRGIVLAVLWTMGGFWLSAMLPGSGVTSVAELVTTCLGFTIWTFLGLLTLPTVSRQSAYAIDDELLRRGADGSEFIETVRRLDKVQDDEPVLITWIEMIFHPVPSLENRKKHRSGRPIAWHAARMTLFLSWSCLGLLSRAVHCNVGRMELWAMLPTD